MKGVKSVFGELEAAVGFGLDKEYCFDTRSRHRPKLSGKVIASLSVNYRISPQERHGEMRFFTLNVNEFNEEQMEKFCSEYLLLLLKWYLSKSSISDLGGVEEILIEWSSEKFVIHEMKYA